MLRRLGLGPGRPVDAGRALRPGAGPDHRRSGRHAGSAVLAGGSPRAARRPRRWSGPAVPAGCARRGSRPVRWCCGPGRAGAVVARPDGTVELELGRRHRPRRRAGRSPGRRPAPGLAASAGSPRPEAAGPGWLELEPVGAPGYDGGAIAHTPAGRIAFTTRHRVSAPRPAPRSTRAVEGSVISYRLDSGTYRTRWGRMFLDACLPPRTGVTARFLTTDDDTVPDPIDPAPPARPLLAGRPVRRSTTSPTRRCRRRARSTPAGRSGRSSGGPPDREDSWTGDRRGVRDLRGAGARATRPLPVGAAEAARHRPGHAPGSAPSGSSGPATGC